MMKASKTLTIQISAGKHKGKRLQLPSLDTTRSSKNILKNAFFDSIQFDIQEKLFVEVFAGAGSVGLEALSRGAKDAYFIEIDKDAHRVLVANAKAIDAKHSHITHADSFVYYPQLLQALPAPAYLYFDPPFDIREGMHGIYERVLELIAQTPKEKAIMIVIEHMTKMEMPESIGVYTKQKFKKFGRSALSYYACVG